MPGSVSLRLRLTLLLVSLVLSVAAVAQAPRYTVNVPVANMFSSPASDTDVVSQAIYGTNVAGLEENDNWVRIRTLDDNYTGWAARAELRPIGELGAYATTGEIVQVRSLRAHVYQDPDVTLRAPILTVPFETRLQFVAAKPGQERWLQIRLTDGRLAWIQQGDVSRMDAAASPKLLDIPSSVELAKLFLGLPYTWGGRSSYGFDCSGFVQMLLRWRGYNIPRDAGVQANWEGYRSVAVADLQAGDVLYFGSDGKVTHTGMFIGNGQFIHSTTHDRPMIQISPLNDYWKKLLLGQRRVKP